MNFKKISIIAILSTIALATCYTAGWFIIAHNIKKNIDNKIDLTINNTNSLEDLSMQTKIECFPFICLNISNINANINTNSNPNYKRELFINILEHNNIKINIKNILQSPTFVINEQNKDFDIYIADKKDPSLNVKSNLLVKNFKLISKNGLVNLNIKNAIFEKSSTNHAFIALGQIGSLDMKVENKKENLNINYQLANTELFNFKLKEQDYKILHSLLNANYNKPSNTLTVNDFKFTDILNQATAKGSVSYKNNQLNNNLQINIRAKEENTIYDMLYYLQNKLVNN